MPSTARELNMSDTAVKKIVAEDSRYRLYVLRRGYNFALIKFFPTFRVQILIAIIMSGYIELHADVVQNF